MGTNRRRQQSGNKIVWIVLGIVGGVFALILLTCAGGIFLVKRAATQIIGSSEQARAGLEHRDEDYAEARKGFQTRLMQRGPAPQQADPIGRPPNGAEEVQYTSGNLKLKAWVSSAKAGAGSKLPAVLFLHGGFAFGEDDWEMAQPFRDAGFAVMVPMLRGENGQPGEFSCFYNEVDDALAAVEVLAKRQNVDGNRLYVAGHSAGGTLTLLAALSSKRFRAAASFSGSPDQVVFTRFQDELVVFDRNDPREFRLRSPVAYAGSFKCPTRLYYGTAEIGFEPSSQRTAMLAKGKGLDVEAMSVPGDHQTSVPAAIRQAIAFFRQH